MADPTPPRAPSRLTRGRALALAWLTFGVFYSLQSYTFNLSVGRAQEWSSFVGFELLFLALLALPTPLVLILGRRWPIVGPGRGRRIVLHAAVALPLAFLARLTFEAIQRSIRATPETPFTWTRAAQATLGSFETGVFVYLIVLLATHFWDYYERWGEERVQAAHLRADLSAAQLEVLRTQIQPHFLFNTMNAISVLIDESPTTAKTMLGHLGDFLRATLAESGRQVIPLGRELELLGHYLEIERTRFGDRLVVTTEVVADALDAPVPALLLQPLVENAIRHGISRHPGPGRVDIEAKQRDGDLVLVIRNVSRGSAPGLSSGSPTTTASSSCGSASSAAGAGTETPPVISPRPGAESAPAGFGIGLRNTQARLRELYGEEQTFTFRSLHEGGREIGAEVMVAIGRNGR